MSMIRLRRSALFLPASRPELLPKALASGADLVCFDLEDAVPPDKKESARGNALAFLANPDASGTPERAVRINSPRSRAGVKDLARLLDAPPLGGVLMLPKVESAEEILWVDRLLTEADSSLTLAALIESALGVERAFEIAAASRRVELVVFGGADLAAELGTLLSREPLAYGRARVVYAAHHAGLDVLDVPCVEFRDDEAVRREAEQARLLGFTGKAVIHPMNVDTVNAVFTPGEAEIEDARRIVEAFRASGTGVAVVDGRIVERPIVRVMEKKLARAHAATATHG